jgi:hypothetical protein
MTNGGVESQVVQLRTLLPIRMSKKARVVIFSNRSKKVLRAAKKKLSTTSKKETK